MYIQGQSPYIKTNGNCIYVVPKINDVHDSRGRSKILGDRWEIFIWWFPHICGSVLYVRLQFSKYEGELYSESAQVATTYMCSYVFIGLFN